jgi:magnesium transporter
MKNTKKLESLLSKGEDYVLHYILDKEVDKYVVVRETIADDLHKIEEDFLSLQDSDVLKILFEKEKLVLEVSHATDSITNMCLMLKKPTDNFISNGLIPYFADVHDHAYKSNQGLNAYLKQIEAMRNTNLALNSNKLNQSIQILTIVMALMMPMTIVTGFFGMNVPLPFQTNIHAYQILILMMIITVGVLLILFRNFGWVGKKKS